MRKTLLLSILMLFCVFVFAQTRTVTGRVLDNKGQPVAYATVSEAGTANAVQADANGNFTITVKQNARLNFTATGFKTQTVAANNVVNVSLVQGENELEEVVVTAQGIKRRPKELGYSVGKVNNQDVTAGHSPRLAEALSGKVSGLTVYNIDNSVDPRVKIVLRGYRSLTGSNDALVVLDGIMNVPQSSLAALNPNDIESVTILKGGQAATLYGSAGVNGAVIITTKKGSAGKLKVNYSISSNVEKLAFLPEFQDKYGNGSHYTAGYGAAGYLPNYLDRMKENWRPFENQQYGDAYNGEPRIIGRVTEDGSKNIIPYAAIPGERRRAWNTGHTTNNQVGFSGGDATSTYYLSAENNRTKGIVPGDKSERNSVRLASSKESGNLKVGFNAAYVQGTYDRTTSDFYFDMLNVAGHIPISQYRDWRNNKFANPNGFYDDYYNNPYFNADNNRQVYSDANISGALELNYKFLPWLSANNHLGVVNNSRNRKNYTSKFLYSPYAKNTAYVPAPWDWANDYDGIDRANTDILGSVLDQVSTENVINNEFQVQANKNFGDFSNKLILGQSVYQKKNKQVNVASGSIVQDSIYNVNNRQGELTGGESNSTYRKFGYYADLTTGWRDMIFGHVSFRYDGTSVFYKTDRATNLYQYPYYGADVSVVLTELLPSVKNKFLNYAKLRAGYNKNANDNLDPYNLDLTYPTTGGFPYGNNVGFTVGDILPDPNLKPETVSSFEAGAELQLLDNRINLDFTGYTQKSTNSIITVKIPSSTGFTNYRLNIGETKNWGYETDLKVQIIRKANFNLELNGNYSYNGNKVTKLFPGVDEFAYAGGYSYAQPFVMLNQSFPTLKAIGYVRDSATGRVIVNKTDGYPIQSSGLLNFGRTTPPHVAGLGTRIRFKDFTFSANAEYRGGNKIFHQLGRDMTFTGAGKWTENRTPHIFPNSAYDDGTGKYVPNNDVYVREAEYSLWVDKYRFITENFITPGWFIKLRDINLSYNIPSRLTNKTKILSGATISIYGRNLITIVDKTNVFTDPEFSTTTGNGQGVNNTGNTPPVRQYGFNINLNF
jgi:TonB-linked SusC/RagA family outer membrane protein